MSKYGYFEPSRPRKSDVGIKARSQRGEFVEHWWAERWIKSMERITDAGRVRRGRAYARGGQVLSIKENKGQIEGRVQGSRSTPYRVVIKLEPLSDAQWESVLDAFAAQAIFTAQLMAGEMPQEIEEAFTAAGVSLLPDSSAELETECTCPDWANPCKHVAAVHYILGEQFDEDPFLIFRMRGRNQAQILAALRARRQTDTTDAPAIAEMSSPYTVAKESAPLPATPATFWRMSQALDHFPTAIQPPAQPYPVLRRLGAPAFAKHLEEMLGPAYDAMTEAALRVAFANDSASPSQDDEAGIDEEIKEEEDGA